MLSRPLAFLVLLSLGLGARLPSAGSCSILAYGALCDNASDDAPHIQRALDDEAACASVLVPAGRACVSRALNVSRMSGRALVIEGDLVIWRDPKTYPTSAQTNMFLSATDGDGSFTGALLSRFTLGGGGRVLGGGAAWWPSAGSVQRPRILWLPNASDVTVANLTLVDSPAWNVGLRGVRLLVENVRVEAGMGSCGGFALAKNTDGVNIGGQDITVRNLWVHNGDDCVPITTGNEGLTSNVLVDGAHCECGTNGVVIYNQGGTISGVLARNVTVVGTNQGAGVKLARPGRDATGGRVANVTFADYSITRPRFAALYVNVFQEDAKPPCVLPPTPDLRDWLTVQGLRFRTVSATVAAGQAAGCFRCTPGAPCSAVFDGVEVRQHGAGGAPAKDFVCLNMAGEAGAGGSVPAACAAG